MTTKRETVGHRVPPPVTGDLLRSYQSALTPSNLYTHTARTPLYPFRPPLTLKERRAHVAPQLLARVLKERRAVFPLLGDIVAELVGARFSHFLNRIDAEILPTERRSPLFGDV